MQLELGHRRQAARRPSSPRLADQRGRAPWPRSRRPRARAPPRPARSRPSRVDAAGGSTPRARATSLRRRERRGGTGPGPGPRAARRRSRRRGAPTGSRPPEREPDREQQPVDQSDSRAVPLSTGLSSPRLAEAAHRRAAAGRRAAARAAAAARGERRRGRRRPADAAEHGHRDGVGDAQQQRRTRPASRRAPSITASVRLPAAASVGMSRRLLTTRIAVISAPGGHRGRQEQRLQPPAPAGRPSRPPPPGRRTGTRTPRPGPVAVRERAAGVRERGDDREHAEREQHRPADRRQPQAHHARPAR